MPYLILGVGLLGLLLLAARSFVAADPSAMAQYAGWFVIGTAATGTIAFLIVMATSERLGPALVFATGAGIIGFRIWRRWRAAEQIRAARVTTSVLSMELDQRTGAMTGRVLRGTYAGRRIEDLDQAELIALWRQCVAEDEASARLLESYLDRLRPDWRQAASGGSGSGGGAGAPGDVMTREQAYAILDLESGASAEQIKEAHRRLMMKLHPDHGGSTFLAAQINRAKEFLLGE
jgi:hypothetical protein